MKKGTPVAMYDVLSLKTPEECRIVADRVLKLGMKELYQRVIRRLAELSTRHICDEVERDLFLSLEIHEATVLYRKHGRRVAATRTRQAIERKGVNQTLIDWSKLGGDRQGFRDSVEAGFACNTGEAIVVRHADKFPPDVVERCKDTLQRAGVDLDEMMKRTT